MPTGGEKSEIAHPLQPSQANGTLGPIWIFGTWLHCNCSYMWFVTAKPKTTINLTHIFKHMKRLMSYE